MTPEITLSHDHVVVEGHRIERPERLSPSQWLEFWGKLDSYADGYDAGYVDGYDAGYADASDH